MLKVEQIDAGIYLISVGNPDSNIYLVNGDTLIDSSSGMHASVVMKALEKLGINANEIKRIINTHHHIEHVGGNSLFPEAKKMMHKKAFEVWHKKDYIKTHAIMYPLKIVHVKADVLLEHNNSINLDQNFFLRVLQSPDNEDGHICLFDENRKILFSGDTEKELIESSMM